MKILVEELIFFYFFLKDSLGGSSWCLVNLGFMVRISGDFLLG